MDELNDDTKQLLEVKDRQDHTDRTLDQLIDGVELVTVQVTTLNERVYTKNYLDRIRNSLLIGSIITFLIVSGFLGLLLHHQNTGDEERSREATLGRRQIADCTVKPGVVLEDGYVNPGICYTESNARTSEAVNKITEDITESIRKLLIAQDEAAAADRALAEEIRRSSQAQADALKKLNSTSTTIPTIVRNTTSTVTTIARPPVTSPPAEPGLLCNVLSVLGLCDA